MGNKRDGTPKEKAKELMSCFSDSSHFSTVCVGFIEQALINCCKDSMELQNMYRELNYWNEVKLEIEKL